MAKLTLSFSDLYKKVSEFLGLGSSPTGTDLTLVKDLVYRGYRQFLYPISPRSGELHDWSFLKQLCVISVTSGKWKYMLPNNFSDFLDVPHFEDSQGYNELTKIGPEQILELRNATVSSGFPVYFAVAPFKYENKIGTFYEMWIDPEPDGTYVLKFFYRIDPLKPEGDDDLLVGGIKATEAILESCLAVAEQQEDDNAGLHTQLANELVQKLILSDVQEESDILGNLASPKPPLHRWYSALPPDAGDSVYVGD